MSHYNQRILAQIEKNPALLNGICRGVERECLRVTEEGRLALTPHPPALGSALTHPLITTDYSESLLEFITPVETDIDKMLATLADAHKFTSEHIHGELLWPLSMPCYIGDDANIPIANYGTSNIGQMKSLYRRGLHNRYGSAMQVISGLHFNLSFPENIWQLWSEDSTNDEASLAFIRSDGYLSLIRNFRRLCWVLPFLFGASPALCRSFVDSKGSDLPFKQLGKGTFYLPHATSLRMSDLGYTNKAQSRLMIDYNSLAGYVASVRRALNTPEPRFEALGVYKDGQWQQLNSNLLQIENELYSPVRPKRVAKSKESPTHALIRGGVEYVEVRALDVDPFSELGITRQQVLFLDLYLVHCLLSDSSYLGDEQMLEASQNLNSTILYGRAPSVTLTRQGQSIKLTEWLGQELQQMEHLAELMDSAYQGHGYREALKAQQAKCQDPDLTPSARLLSELSSGSMDNADIALKLARQHQISLQENDYKVVDVAQFEQFAGESAQQQADIEAADTISFDTFVRAQQAR